MTFRFSPDLALLLGRGRCGHYVPFFIIYKMVKWGDSTHSPRLREIRYVEPKILHQTDEDKQKR